MKLLDLFCGAGGAAMGYHRAGFDEIVGVDIKPQPRYPFTFVQGDALDYLLHHGQEFDAIHSSPPCQAYMRGGWKPEKDYPDLLPMTRSCLENWDLPWVIENVPGAPMRSDYVLCGCMFGLPKLKRQRWFETSWKGFSLLPQCRHTEPSISVTGTGTPSGTWIKYGSVGIGTFRLIMGIEWMRRGELSQAIPPAYTEFIGRQLLASVCPR